MFATPLYLAEPGLKPRHLAISGHALKNWPFLPHPGKLTHKRSNLHSSPTGGLAGLDGAKE